MLVGLYEPPAVIVPAVIYVYNHDCSASGTQVFRVLNVWRTNTKLVLIQDQRDTLSLAKRLAWDVSGWTVGLLSTCGVLQR